MANSFQAEDIPKILEHLNATRQVDNANVLTRDEIIDAIRAAHSDLDNNTIDSAITAFEKDQLSFVPPQKGVKYIIAKAYVHKAKVATIGIVGTAVVATSLSIPGLMQQVHESSERSKREAATHSQQEQARQKSAIDAPYRRIIGLAQERHAKEEAKRLYDHALAAISVDDSSFKRHISEMNNLEEKLNKTINLQITGTVARSYRGSTPAFYVKVRATDENGQPTNIPIYNQETKIQETVSTWAEQVDKNIHDAAFADKKDNGVVDNDYFGGKKRGHTEITLEYNRRKIPRGKQITRW